MVPFYLKIPGGASWEIQDRAVSVLHRNGGRFCPRRTGCLPSRGPISFRKKKWGKEKTERGTSRSPLHSPPKGRPFQGAAPFEVLTYGFFCGIRPLAGLRIGGSAEGVSPLCAFFPTAFFAKKAVPPLGKRPARRAQKSPAWPGSPPYRLFTPRFSTPRGSSPLWPACRCAQWGCAAVWALPAAFPACPHRRPDSSPARRPGVFR